MSQITGRIHSVESFGALDGPGIRYVLFFQGCALRCRYCHNPDTWDYDGGKEITVNEVLAQISRYKHFISGGGVTFSGGEPLLQPEFLHALIKGCKQRELHTAIDTSGSASLAQCQEILLANDLLMLDIKSPDTEKCKALTGQGNENAFAFLDFCEWYKKSVWIRHVLVPGITLVEEDLEMLAQRLKAYDCIERVELLPYHKMGDFKYTELKMKNELENTPEPTNEELAMAEKIFISHGLIDAGEA